MEEVVREAFADCDLDILSSPTRLPIIKSLLDVTEPLLEVY
jgi:hypothetical protein